MILSSLNRQLCLFKRSLGLASGLILTVFFCSQAVQAQDTTQVIIPDGTGGDFWDRMVVENSPSCFSDPFSNCNLLILIF